MNERLIRQIMGMVMILLVVGLNTAAVFVCPVGGCTQMDTYSWGFLNGIILVGGLTMLGG